MTAVNASEMRFERLWVVAFICLALAAMTSVVAAVASLAAGAVQCWGRHDVELKTRLIFTSIRDQGAVSLAAGEASSLPLFERIAEDRWVVGLGYCEGGVLHHATKHMPAGFRCSAKADQNRETFTTTSQSGHRLLIGWFPISARLSGGHLVILHDLGFVDKRASRARRYAAGALSGIILGGGLLAAAAGIGMRRDRSRKMQSIASYIRLVADGSRTGRGDLSRSAGAQALLRHFRPAPRDGDGLQVHWSPDTLLRLLQERLPGCQVIAVSNREPYIHNRSGASIDLQVPASGLVAALEPVMRACGGTWIAHGSGSGDRATVDERDHIRVPPNAPSYTLRRIWVTEEEQEGYYYGLANEALWPLCHIAFVRPTFRLEDWQRYAAINQRFADAVVEEATCPDPIVLVHDYHFALVPGMVRARLPTATILAFWHIPWPNAETFSICPWRQEIMKGLLGSTILGFHTQAHCNNFLEATDRFLESRIDRERASVTVGGHQTLVRPYPISIEWPPGALLSQASAGKCREAVKQRYCLPSDASIVVGIERFDYTKGILDRLRALDDLLARRPTLKGRLVLLQAAAPTRSRLAAYGNLHREAEQLAEQINGRHGSTGYTPIVLSIRHHEPDEVFELFRAADACIVSSLHDGMNLVAKEFVASRDDEQGVLILSTFAGAARELPEALIVNPYDIHSVGETLECALRMPVAEQRARMRSMRDWIRVHNVYRWAGQMLIDAARIRSQHWIASARYDPGATADRPQGDDPTGTQ